MVHASKVGTSVMVSTMAPSMAKLRVKATGEVPSHLIRDNASSFNKLLRDAVRTSGVPLPRAAKRRAATAGLA